MEKTPDVILQAIDIHSTLSMCKFCPYGPVPDCELILMQDAAELIRKLQCEQTVHAVWIHCKDHRIFTTAQPAEKRYCIIRNQAPTRYQRNLCGKSMQGAENAVHSWVDKEA